LVDAQWGISHLILSGTNFTQGKEGKRSSLEGQLRLCALIETGRQYSTGLEQAYFSGLLSMCSLMEAGHRLKMSRAYL